MVFAGRLGDCLGFSRLSFVIVLLGLYLSLSKTRRGRIGKPEFLHIRRFCLG